MSPEEVIDVLAKAAAFDQRTIGEADVLAWHEVLARIDFGDALTAVTRHYGESAERLMPADVIRHARAVREERVRLAKKHPVRGLPGRFETDEERDARNKANIERIRREILLPLAERLSADRGAA